MRIVAVMLWSVACGSNPEVPVDSAPEPIPDAPPDAFDGTEDIAPYAGPNRCPAAGEMLQLDATAHLVGANCGDYSDRIAANLAVLRCEGGWVQGPIDGPFAPATFSLPLSSPEGYAPKGLTPESKLLVEGRRNTSTIGHPTYLQFWSRYSLVGGTWIRGQEIAIGPPFVTEHHRFFIPTLSARSVKRALVGPTYGDGEVFVLELDAMNGPGPWNEIRRYSWGAGEMPSMSADALRAVSADREGIYLRDRANADVPFSDPRLALAAPVLDAFSNPFLNDDCSRLYYRDGTTLVYREITNPLHE